MDFQQVVLDGGSTETHREGILRDSLLIPAYTSGASAVILTLHIILQSQTFRSFYARLVPTFSRTGPDPSNRGHLQSMHPASFGGQMREHIVLHGGMAIFAHKIARLVGCAILLGFSIATFILEKADQVEEVIFGITGKHWGKKHKHQNRKLSPNDVFSEAEWLQFALCMSITYVSFLALASVSARPRWSRLVTNHLAIILLVLFSVYFYRDIWPFATFAERPLDSCEGWLLWGKIIILSVVSILIPLTIPRQYVPFNPKDPAAIPNPEQTASLFSLLLWFFLDPIVFLAYRIPHLSHDQLPPLADYDQAKNLVKTSFPSIDQFSGSKKRHIFWGLMTVYRNEYIIMALMLVVQVLAGLASPIGIKQLLMFLENSDQVVVRPWVWILSLFLAPTIGSICFQWYIFLATRTLVRTESIITQLVFNHALRIRMKAELPESAGAESSPSTAVVSPDNVSVADQPIVEEAGESLNGSVDETVAQSSLLSVKSVTGSRKGKQKAKYTRLTEQTVPKEATADNFVGKINNLVTTDLNNITEARDFLFLFVFVPLQVGLSVWFLYTILGWSAFVGLATMVVLFPIPGYVAKMIQAVQVARMKKTDARMQTVTETMNVLRMIKLFGWEKKMNSRIADKREGELEYIKKRQILDLCNNNLNFVIPVMTMLVTYTTYTLLMQQDLTASSVFSSMSVFDMLRDQLHIVFWTIPRMVQGKVSLDRVNDFLINTELLDSFAEKTNEVIGSIADDIRIAPNEIGFRHAIFSWSNTSDGSLTPSRRQFSLHIEDELYFKKGRINLVVGPTGSGKTSLLMALLGEMHFIPSGPNSFFNLPRGNGVAYAAQESWVQNETIKENILFGSPFDETRYKRVIFQCGLSRDLDLFDAGDQTEVGEKGLTLSGGQKARITLARAIYSSAEILLLDDVLAALDVHTAKHITDKCFSGDLVEGRTIILVTHNVAMTSPIAHFVVSLGIDGRVVSQGSISSAFAGDRSRVEEAIDDREAMKKAAEEITPIGSKKDTAKGDGKLTVAEEIQEGHVSWQALKLFFAGLGGNHPLLFWIVFVGGLFLTDFISTIQTWWLGFWASQYDYYGSYEVDVSYYLTVYTLLLAAACICYSLAYLIYIFGSLRASRIIHNALVESVLGTTLRWLDKTPTSRVIARCTQDIRAVDGPVNQTFGFVVELSLSMIIKLSAVIILTPIFLFPSIFVAILGAWCGQIYIRAQLSVKREMSNARSPVLGHFGSAISGLVSIRAYGAQAAFKEESLVRIDRYTRAARTFYNLNRWVCIRIDGLGALFTAGLAAYLVYGAGIAAKAHNTGFSLNMAVGFSSLILWWVRLLNEFEVSGNSLERIQDYVSIEQEPKPSVGGMPPTYWPASGDIRVENLSARYFSDGPKVLHELSFHVKSGERIGVVGRTGSGKSSLTLALLRCILTDGTVYYDGLPTSSLNLDALRSNITIIPQVPELLSGTLRQNLDPFEQYDDATLNDALHAAGLFSLQGEMEQGRITLDSPISAGGSNLSVGQRQILALARAIVRGSKLLILDEATSAVDYKTDALIQSSLRNELGGDVTLITVAHRLQTIMDADKIMVLDAGHIIEFDQPSELLKDEKGMFRALVDESSDRENLIAIAETKALTRFIHSFSSNI